MTSNQVTINSPGTDDTAYVETTCELSTYKLFELPGRRWGIKLNEGAIVFRVSVDGVRSISVAYKELKHDDAFRKCRILSGKVEITYTP